MRLALALWAVAASAAAVEGPVAVMSFKNLNADPQMDWMRVGVAETLVSDLKKRSTLRVVERDQVDKALSEVMLQGKQGAEESTAAKVGKLVGAKTIVLGAFQKAGNQLRITARFITAETGEVVDTAKTTGPVSDVFLLQDGIVARLMGEKWVKPTAAKANTRRASPKRLKAYQFYAMALTTASDADRVNYLNQSIEQDPEFSYALDALDALKKRMEGYRKNAVQAGDEEEVRLRKAMDDSSQPLQQRMNSANFLMVHYLTRQQHTNVKAFCKEILANPEYADLHEQMLFRLFESERQTAETDAAFHHGEEFLKRFPKSPFFSGWTGWCGHDPQPRGPAPERSEVRGTAEADREVARGRRGREGPQAGGGEAEAARPRPGPLQRSHLDAAPRARRHRVRRLREEVGRGQLGHHLHLPGPLRDADGGARLFHDGQERQGPGLGNRIIKEYPEQARDWRIDEIVSRAWAGE